MTVTDPDTRALQLARTLQGIAGAGDTGAYADTQRLARMQVAIGLALGIEIRRAARFGAALVALRELAANRSHVHAAELRPIVEGALDAVDGSFPDAERVARAICAASCRLGVGCPADRCIADAGDLFTSTIWNEAVAALGAVGGG